MSLRTKLILLGIILILLAIPIWHAGSNWAPADPLRFRLISRESLPGLEFELDGDGEAYRSERVEIEVRNTTTAPRHLENAEMRWYSAKTDTPFWVWGYLVDPFSTGPVIPPGGTWRGTFQLSLPEPESGSGSGSENRDPGYVRLRYSHASTFRLQVCHWCESLFQRYLPDSQKAYFMMHTCTKSTATLEDFP